MSNLIPKIKIKVIGVGGAGCNAVSRMMSHKIGSVEFIAANTDAQDLKKARAHFKVRLGRSLTKGLGTGMNPAVGRDAARESQKELEDVLTDADMLFIAAGLGGGTGTGAAPVIADIAKQKSILTVAVTTYPFSFEGAERRRVARDGVLELRERVDTLLTIANDKIFAICEKNTPMRQAFWLVDDVLRQAVQGISDLIVTPGFINVDFADIKSIIRRGGEAVFGVGMASGENRARHAVDAAISSPFFNFSIEGCRSILFNIASCEDVSLADIAEISSIVSHKVDSRAKVIFGAVRDPKLKKGDLKITIIATGLPGRADNWK